MCVYRLHSGETLSHIYACVLKCVCVYRLHGGETLSHFYVCVLVCVCVYRLHGGETLSHIYACVLKCVCTGCTVANDGRQEAIVGGRHWGHALKAYPPLAPRAASRSIHHVVRMD